MLYDMILNRLRFSVVIAKGSPSWKNSPITSISVNEGFFFSLKLDGQSLAKSCNYWKLVNMWVRTQNHECIQDGCKGTCGWRLKSKNIREPEYDMLIKASIDQNW